jgi:4-hydroxybenzoate polyprenyltransferase
MAISLSQRAGAFLGMVRWGNQVIILFCLFSFHRLMLRFDALAGAPPAMDFMRVAMLGCSLVALTMAGYLINALRDVDTDRLNHPDRRWIPVPFSAKSVLFGYYLALFAGFLPAVWLSANLGLWIWLPLYPLTAYLLHRYSSAWKGHGLWGNLLVAALSAAVPLLLLVPESDFLVALPEAPRYTLIGLYAGFVLFALLVSLFREMVKDLEDLSGDRMAGWQTFPVARGEGPARRFALWTGLLSALALLAALQLPVPKGSFQAGLLILAMLQGGLLFRLVRARSSRDYRGISQAAKGLLAGGLFLIWLAP